MYLPQTPYLKHHKRNTICSRCSLKQRTRKDRCSRCGYLLIPTDSISASLRLTQIRKRRMQRWQKRRMGSFKKLLKKEGLCPRKKRKKERKSQFVTSVEALLQGEKFPPVRNVEQNNDMVVAGKRTKEGENL